MYLKTIVLCLVIHYRLTLKMNSNFNLHLIPPIQVHQPIAIDAKPLFPPSLVAYLMTEEVFCTSPVGKVVLNGLMVHCR